MSYIDKSLGDGEAVIARAQFHWLYNLSAWLQLLVPAVLLIALLSWASRQPNFLDTGNPVTWTGLGCGLKSWVPPFGPNAPLKL